MGDNGVAWEKDSAPWNQDRPGVGCLFDGHHGQYIYDMIVDLAHGYGYRRTDLYKTELWRQKRDGEDRHGVQATELIVEEAERAEEWLNENVAEEGYSFGWHDGEFFYQPAAWWQDDEIDPYNDISNDNEEETT